MRLANFGETLPMMVSGGKEKNVGEGCSNERFIIFSMPRLFRMSFVPFPRSSDVVSNSQQVTMLHQSSLCNAIIIFIIAERVDIYSPSTARRISLWSLVML